MPMQHTRTATLSHPSLATSPLQLAQSAAARGRGPLTAGLEIEPGG